jgi:hypothetical protein
VYFKTNRKISRYPNNGPINLSKSMYHKTKGLKWYTLKYNSTFTIDKFRFSMFNYFFSLSSQLTKHIACMSHEIEWWPGYHVNCLSFVLDFNKNLNWSTRCSRNPSTDSWLVANGRTDRQNEADTRLSQNFLKCLTSVFPPIVSTLHSSHNICCDNHSVTHSITLALVHRRRFV